MARKSEQILDSWPTDVVLGSVTMIFFFSFFVVVVVHSDCHVRAGTLCCPYAPKCSGPAHPTSACLYLSS